MTIRGIRCFGGGGGGGAYSYLGDASHGEELASPGHEAVAGAGRVGVGAGGSVALEAALRHPLQRLQVKGPDVPEVPSACGSGREGRGEAVSFRGVVSLGWRERQRCSSFDDVVQVPRTTVAADDVHGGPVHHCGCVLIPGVRGKEQGVVVGFRSCC